MMSGLRGRCLRAARRRSSWVAGLSAFGLGALLSVSLAPLHILLSLPLALGGLGVLALWARSPLQASAIGWLAGAGYFGFGLSWIVEPFQVDAARYAWCFSPLGWRCFGQWALAWPSAGAQWAGKDTLRRAGGWCFCWRSGP
jgi:apolipoprotein N-acyltransferase